MRKISEQRRLVETEGVEHAVVRGRIGRWHFENMPRLQKVLYGMLKMSGTEGFGRRHAMEVQVVEVEFEFDNLPGAFDGYRVLFLSDFHIDGLPELAEIVLEAAGKVEYDLCVLGGDYSFDHHEECDEAKGLMRQVGGVLAERSRVVGVMGNHDRYSMGEVLAECGVEMLLNESVRVERGGEAIWVAGVDDYHYFGAHDFDMADEGIEEGAFKVMVCHTPEGWREAAKRGYSLFLAGHTHGGQVCLPGGVMLVRGATVRRGMLRGAWRDGEMAGYTSRGVGVSGIPVRHWCRPEMTVLTMRRGR
ncbi:phosphodiesterase YaeI [Anaerohalosphaera lusitana]|uniref:Phosphodiesterase YaeI n=1 Tax=Anaerohalosphaera lusitana TaxID=1936003 RepID=A0A1U9NNV0_9BACT|nr:metallophosphoesterase [Anaerohalosphaera lusitana]AQT69290.1 phosphodiesterase YaeI [Anaerohalosphaera lusitana]